MTNASLSRRPFYVHIATLFILLFSLLGGALIVLQFQQGMQQGLEHERQSFQQYREQLALAIKLNQRPARMSLNLLRSGQLSAMTGLETRLAFLPQLAEVLANSTSYGAIYAGYEDGDFFLVRKLTERARGALEAPPPESRLLVQSLHQGQGEFLYFDQRLRLLERRPMPDYRFDPRDRGWYKEARWSTGIIVTHPYLFFTTREPGMTLAVESDDRRAVIGLDAGVEGLSSLIGELPLPGHSQLVLFDEVGTLLATDPERLPSFEQLSRLPMLSALNHPILTRLQQEMAARPALLHHPAELTLATVQGQEWLVNLSSLGEESPFYLALLVPTEVLTAPARQDALHNLAWALAGLLLLLPVIWLAARRTAAPLLVLTGEAERIQHFDFGESPGPDSAIREIDDLARAMSSMRLTLGNFMNMGRALAAEHRFDSLLSRILHETVAAAQAEGGCLFLAQESEMQAVHAIWQGQPLACEQVQWQAALLGGLYHTERLCLPLDEAAVGPLPHRLGPLPRCLPTAGRAPSQPPSGADRLPAADPARLLGPRTGLAHQPHRGTGGHLLLRHRKPAPAGGAEATAGSLHRAHRRCHRCQEPLHRRPLPAGAGTGQDADPGCLRTADGALCRFPAQRRGVGGHPYRELAARLRQGHHPGVRGGQGDQTRDHLRQDPRDPHPLRGAQAGCPHRGALRPAAAIRAAGRPQEAVTPLWHTLDQEFAFVAECNLGGEWMAPEKLARLDTIASRTWLRTLDDRLGISQEERKRHQEAPSPLPCRESLLADKAVHLIPRPEHDNLARHNPWGFKVRVPTHLYNRGERYNLAIGRGTLTEEERYKIDDHIIQTIRMLEKLPFPRHLRKVPEIAGGHHERMDGTGYPRQLQGGQ